MTNPELFQVKIHLTSKCSLSCIHCLNSTHNIPQIVSDLDFVKKQIDFVYDMGIRMIELGVLIGDSLEYPIELFESVLDYIGNRFDSISISTSMIFLTKKHIELFNKFDTVKLQLSWYGKDKEEYRKITGIDGYDKLIKNLEYFKEANALEVTVISMFSEKTTNHELINILDSIAQTNNRLKIQYDNIAPVGDWELMLTDEKKLNLPRKGACQYLFADLGITWNGNVLACAWFDYNEMEILGNIYTSSPEEVLANHKRIVQQQNFGIFKGSCRNCTVYQKKVGNEKKA